MDTSSSASAGSTQNRAWIDDGIIFAEYNHPSGTEDVLALMNECILKLHQSGISVAPIIIIFNPQGNLSRLNITQLGKLVNTQLVRHLSVVYIVGAEHIGNSSLITMGSNLFLGGRVHVAKDLAEAIQAAKKVRNDTRPILEQ